MGRKGIRTKKQEPAKQPSPQQTLNAPTSNLKPAYNVAYEKLVADDKDIIGQLSYCLYKQSKQKYIREFEALHGRSPNSSELHVHVTCSELPNIEMYRQAATRVFTELLEQAAAEKESELEHHFKQRLWDFIHRHEPEDFLEKKTRQLRGLLYSGTGGVIGNALTTLLVVLFLYLSASDSTRAALSTAGKENFISGMAQVFGVSIIIPPKTPHSAPQGDANQSKTPTVNAPDNL